MLTKILALCAHLLHGGEVGEASWYGPGFYGHPTASGRTYTGREFTVAHPQLPLGSAVRVLNLLNCRWAYALVDDRGPYARGRIVDLSPAVARSIGMRDLAPVEVSVVWRASVNPADGLRRLAAGSIVPAWLLSYASHPTAHTAARSASGRPASSGRTPTSASWPSRWTAGSRWSEASPGPSAAPRGTGSSAPSRRSASGRPWTASKMAQFTGSSWPAVYAAEAARHDRPRIIP